MPSLYLLLAVFLHQVLSFQAPRMSRHTSLGSSVVACPSFRHVVLALSSEANPAEQSPGPEPASAETVNTTSEVTEQSSSTEITFATEEERSEAVGNLVADDEWAGLTMELSEIIRRAVIEDIKGNAREFLGKENYQVGDFSKEIDSRVKDEVARLRNKEEYELGDFVFAMDEMSKNLTEQLTGKPYEAGDLSIELDKRIKKAVAGFCGAEEYEFGMLTAEITRRVDERVTEFLGKPYEFGDITRAVEERRKEWVRDFLGDEAAKSYQFGDITKKLINNYTGKKEYQFGDLSKKVFGDIFKKDKK